MRKAKLKYEKIIGTDTQKHKFIIKCLINELELRKSTNTLGYMQQLQTWVNNYTWEKYEDVEDEQSSGRAQHAPTMIITDIPQLRHISKSVERSIMDVQKGIRGNRLVYPTNWARLNKNLMGGLQPGKMYVIAGRPGVGKSAFSNQLIFDLLDKNRGKNVVVLYWSFEMPGEQQILRAGSKDTKLQTFELLSVENKLITRQIQHVCTSSTEVQEVSYLLLLHSTEHGEGLRTSTNCLPSLPYCNNRQSN